MPVFLADTVTTVPEGVATLAAGLSLLGNAGLGAANLWFWRQQERLRRNSGEEQDRLRRITYEALQEAQEREDRAELREDRAMAHREVYFNEIRRLAFAGVQIAEDLPQQLADAERRAEEAWAKRHNKPFEAAKEDAA